MSLPVPNRVAAVPLPLFESIIRDILDGGDFESPPGFFETGISRDELKRYRAIKKAETGDDKRSDFWN